MAILKGEFRQVVHFGVSHLINRERSVAQFESWQDVDKGTSGAMSGHRTHQGVPVTQEELDTYYHALKRNTGLTKSKIGSGKALGRTVRSTDSKSDLVTKTAECTAPPNTGGIAYSCKGVG